MEPTVEKKKRTRVPWVMGIAVLVLFVLLVLLQTSNLWKNLAVETSSDLVLLYSLTTLNFFAFIIFGFIFLRSIIKLVRERRALELGSQIKTRLLMYFLVRARLPALRLQPARVSTLTGIPLSIVALQMIAARQRH